MGGVVCALMGDWVVKIGEPQGNKIQNPPHHPDPSRPTPNPTQVGLLGRPFPISVLERFKAEGRLGAAPERDALARAREVVGDREGQGAMLEALRLRAMAKRLRAEADLAEVELANEKVCAWGCGWSCACVDVVCVLFGWSQSLMYLVHRTSPPYNPPPISPHQVNATMRAALQGMDVGMELLNKPRSGIVPANDPSSREAALDVARRVRAQMCICACAPTRRMHRRRCRATHRPTHTTTTHDNEQTTPNQHRPSPASSRSRRPPRRRSQPWRRPATRGVWTGPRGTRTGSWSSNGASQASARAGSGTTICGTRISRT